MEVVNGQFVQTWQHLVGEVLQERKDLQRKLKEQKEDDSKNRS